MNPILLTSTTVREHFLQARQQGRRAKEAAESIGVSEGMALAAFCDSHAVLPDLNSQTQNTPLQTYALKPQWLQLLDSLQHCGPLMALTRNASTVHEKTGIYGPVSGNDTIGLVLGADIDLRLFLRHWAGGLLVIEPGASNDTYPKTSLQFFDVRGIAVHKIFPVQRTMLAAWHAAILAGVDTQQSVRFDQRLPLASQALQGEGVTPQSLCTDWAAMTDTHQFVDVFKNHALHRLSALQAAQGQFTHQVAGNALNEVLQQAAHSGLSIMVFVGNSGCVQIHTGPVQCIEAMNLRGQHWLNVLDPGFNLHLREDWIGQCWVVEQPTSDGIVTSLEVFDAQGECMAMLFGARQPGQTEPPGWKAVLTKIPILPV